MKTLLEHIRINPSYPFVGRAASRQVCGTLNFVIANAVSNNIRRRTTGVPVEGVDPEKLDALVQKYGNTLDKRNEADEASRGAAYEDQLRSDQGLAPNIDPMEIAGKLNVIRRYIAADLDTHAQVMRNPIDPKGGTYKNPYDIAQPLEESFARQISLQPKINETQLRAQAAAIGLAFEDVLRVTKARNEAGTRFLKANKDEILQEMQMLTATGEDGHALDVDDAESIELGLPPIQRARLFVAADRGLWFERDRCIGLAMRGHPNGMGNMKLVDGARLELHAEFNRLMKTEAWMRDIEDAVARGAQYPVLLALPTPGQLVGAASTTVAGAAERAAA